MNVLIIRFSALGDVAMLVPIVRLYAEKYPDRRITVLSQPFCQPLFEGISKNVEFIGADIKNEYSGISGLWRLFRTLHAMNFDLICDCHDVLRTKVLRVFFKRYGYNIRKIDKHRIMRKLLTTAPPNKIMQQLPSSFENYAEVLGLDPKMVLEQKNHKRIQKSSNYHQTDNPHYGIAPFAGHKGKIYPLEKMEQVIKLLIERRPQCTIYLFGGGGEELRIMEEWEARYRDNVVTTQHAHKGLTKEMQLMSNLDAIISMDSSNMHLASIVGTRVVSIWGATHPFAGFLGWQQSSSDCIQADLACRPCSIYGNKECNRKDYACLNNITPEQIVDKLLSEE